MSTDAETDDVDRSKTHKNQQVPAKRKENERPEKDSNKLKKAGRARSCRCLRPLNVVNQIEMEQDTFTDNKIPPANATDS